MNSYLEERKDEKTGSKREIFAYRIDKN
jgi:hypothetical protein